MTFKSRLIWALRSHQTKALLGRLSEKCDERFKLIRFNQIWREACENIPFYTKWRESHNLPLEIGSLHELNNWPILEKKELLLNREKLVRPNFHGKFHESVTGGATGEPLHFRTWSGEANEVAVNKWLGWAQYGIYPDSRIFLLWGHRHFYGTGIKSDVRFLAQRFKDWMTNNFRVDATDLSVSTLEKDVLQLLDFQPEGIIAYSASLLALCRALPSYAEECRKLNLKAVICTAGPLTKDERLFIGRYFNCPVGMEYGSMEGGVMAYMSPEFEDRYRVFPSTHMLHSVPREGWSSQEVLVTKLYSSYLPLIRYKIGDCLENVIKDEYGIITSFSEVYGRSGDEVNMGRGVRFHGQAFMVCAEGFDKIIGYQIRIYRSDFTIDFLAQTLHPLNQDEKSEICRRAAHLSGLPISSIRVKEVRDLVKAPSGKIRLVLEEV